MSFDSWGGETDWNLIRQAGQTAGGNNEQAWRTLLDRYHVPVRRMLGRLLRGNLSAGDAADDFFTYLYRQRILPKADPEQGRFRCYIQGVMKRYARAYWHASTMPRVADVDEIADRGEDDGNEAEREEELVWAEAVLEHAIARLAQRSPGDAGLLVRFYGLGGGRPESGTDLAREMGISETALHVRLHRARKRLGAALSDELRMQVATREDLEEEREFMMSRLLTAHPGLLGG